jgi:hypothetical protein
MYAALARAVLAEADRGRASADVERLRRKYPRASKDEIARRLVRRAAVQCASAGALLTGPAAFFGSVPVGPGLAYQIVALNRLVLALAALYGRPAEGRDRVAGVAAGAAAGLGSEILRQGLVQLLRRLLPRRLGARTVVGALGGGALGFGAALAVGRFARDAFRGRGRPAWARR